MNDGNLEVVRINARLARACGLWSEQSCTLSVVITHRTEETNRNVHQ